MSLTINQAKDLILAPLAGIVASHGMLAIWPGINDQEPPINSITPWIWATLQHSAGAQAALTNHDGHSIWDMGGTLTIRVFSPYGDGGTAGNDVSDLILTAYRGVKSDVWFRNIKCTEAGKSGAFDLMLILIDFEYLQNS